MIEVNHECYVSLEVAKLLRQLGFDWKCHARYQNGVFTEFQCSSYFEVLIMDFNNAPDYMNQYSAPTLEVAQRWLREVKHLDVIVDRNFPIHEPQYSWEYEYVIIATDGRVEAVDCYFDEYERAQEAGIKKALEIILEKKGE